MAGSTRPNPVHRLGRAGAKLGAVLGFGALTAFGLGFAGFVASLDRAERDPPASADAIVALTGGAQRIGDALDLLGRGFAHRLLITGVNERTSRQEIARLSPHQHKLVSCCVDLDYRARNTLGNAAETRRWVEANGIRSLIVVTSNYHMPRTLAELDHALPGVAKTAHPVTGAINPDDWWGNSATARLLLSEYTKYVAVLTRNVVWPSGRPSSAPAGPAGTPVALTAR